MTETLILFELNRKPGILKVCYDVSRSPTESGLDLFAAGSFDVKMCLGYPTMRAFVSSYDGKGYFTASAWIQIVTRREFASLDADAPVAIVPSVDTHPILAELGVPFFALGFPAEIFDAPCNNLNGLARLEWIADTFLVTMPSRANNHQISYLVGFRWGYVEYDLAGERQAESSPLVVTDVSAWRKHLPLLRSQFGRWQYQEAER